MPFSRLFALLSLILILMVFVATTATPMGYNTLYRKVIHNAMRKYKSNRNVVFSCIYHVVWVTKYRKKYLEGRIECRLKEICTEVASECSFEIKEMECDRDHIHLLIDMDPQFGIHKAVKRMKGKSSRILRQEFALLRQRLPTLWTNSYFVCTVGGAPIAFIKQYIESQKERAAH